MSKTARELVVELLKHPDWAQGAAIFMDALDITEIYGKWWRTPEVSYRCMLLPVGIYSGDIRGGMIRIEYRREFDIQRICPQGTHPQTRRPFCGECGQPTTAVHREDEMLWRVSELPCAVGSEVLPPMESREEAERAVDALLLANGFTLINNTPNYLTANELV